MCPRSAMCQNWLILAILRLHCPLHPTIPSLHFSTTKITISMYLFIMYSLTLRPTFIHATIHSSINISIHLLYKAIHVQMNVSVFCRCVCMCAHQIFHFYPNMQFICRVMRITRFRIFNFYLFIFEKNIGKLLKQHNSINSILMRK